jgi:NAD(P)-dependent dehydrogenase (short-subunit alcohol dehydrogenase family)
MSLQMAAAKAIKAGLVTGSTRDVGFETSLALAKRLPKGSMIFMTVRKEDDIPRLTDQLKTDLEPEVANKLKVVHLDFHDKDSLMKLYKTINSEVATLDILVNNSQKYHLPSIMDDKLFAWQCEDTLEVNYYGLKKMCKIFSPMMNQGGRVVNCSSHLGHLSNLDGMEPYASQLRAKFADHNLAEEELDRLVKQFITLSATGGGGWWQYGWPACPYTVSKIAVNAYTRILQARFDMFHPQKDLVVNAVHHGCMHKDMNSGAGFTPAQAGELVAGLALLPDNTVIKGKVIWRDFMSFDNWQYGGLDDDSKTSKAFVANYDMEAEEASHQYEMNNGFCLDG